MKQSLLISILGVLLITLPAAAAPAQKTAKPASPAHPEKTCVPTPGHPCPVSSENAKKYVLNIMELTNSQMYRYGREMFLSGNNAEAAKVFLEIIRLDCHNRSAHYHLQKIAQRDKAYAFLANTLKNLPCGTYDFEHDDFLPASVYYEKDTDILVEQLAAYHKRQRLSQEELRAQAEKYDAMVAELETTVAALSRLPGNNASDEEILTRVITGRKIANKVDKEIAFLKSQLMSQRLDEQRNIQDLRLRLAAAEAQIADDENKEPITAPTPASTETPAPQAPTPAPQEYSANAQELLAAVEKAKTELQYKERLLAEKDTALSSLQDRFDDILRRLKVIQGDLANKNAQIKAIQTNLLNMQKP